MEGEVVAGAGMRGEVVAASREPYEAGPSAGPPVTLVRVGAFNRVP